MSEKSQYPTIDVSGVDRTTQPIPFHDVITGAYFMSCNPDDPKIYQKCQVVDGQPEMKTVIQMGHQSDCWSTEKARRKDDASLVIPIKVKIVCTT